MHEGMNAAHADCRTRSVHLVQILLPIADNDGRPYDRELLRSVQRELVARFGGATAYLRSPAEGRWEGEDGALVRDRIVICEAMTEQLDRAWWREYRASLADRFRQEEVVVRATQVELL